MQLKKFIPLILSLLAVSLLLAACGDSTATSIPPTPAVTTAAATTALATTAPVATTAAATTAVVTTTAAATTAASTTVAATTAAVTTVSVTTASVATTPAATSAGTGASGGAAKISLQNTTALIGSTINVAGEGFPANTWLTIQFGPNDTTRSVASLALSDAGGKFSTPLILSAYGDGSAITPGRNTILVATQDGKISTMTSLTLSAPAATATPNQ